MVKYSWFKSPVPENLEIKQVYGVVFSNEGNILLRMDDNQYELTGGKPEKSDKNYEETLKREYLEELNIKIEDIHYLGYLLVEENKKQYAQVRMIAKMKQIGEIKPDIDNGKIYKRFMANVNNVKKYLHYSGLAGNQLIDDAINMAKKIYHFKCDDKEYFI